MAAQNLESNQVHPTCGFGYVEHLGRRHAASLHSNHRIEPSSFITLISERNPYEKNMHKVSMPYIASPTTRKWSMYCWQSNQIDSQPAIPPHHTKSRKSSSKYVPCCYRCNATTDGLTKGNTSLQHNQNNTITSRTYSKLALHCMQCAGNTWNTSLWSESRGNVEDSSLQWCRCQQTCSRSCLNIARTFSASFDLCRDSHCCSRFVIAWNMQITQCCFSLHPDWTSYQPASRLWWRLARFTVEEIAHGRNSLRWKARFIHDISLACTTKTSRAETWCRSQTSCQRRTWETVAIYYKAYTWSLPLSSDLVWRRCSDCAWLSGPEFPLVRALKPTPLSAFLGGRWPASWIRQPGSAPTRQCNNCRFSQATIPQFLSASETTDALFWRSFRMPPDLWRIDSHPPWINRVPGWNLARASSWNGFPPIWKGWCSVIFAGLGVMPGQIYTDFRNTVRCSLMSAYRVKHSQ